jgi:hypothetical protein
MSTIVQGLCSGKPNPKVEPLIEDFDCLVTQIEGAHPKGCRRARLLLFNLDPDDPDWKCLLLYQHVASSHLAQPLAASKLAAVHALHTDRFIRTKGFSTLASIRRGEKRDIVSILRVERSLRCSVTPHRPVGSSPAAWQGRTP